MSYLLWFVCFYSCTDCSKSLFNCSWNYQTHTCSALSVISLKPSVVCDFYCTQFYITYKCFTSIYLLSYFCLNMYLYTMNINFLLPFCVISRILEPRAMTAVHGWKSPPQRMLTSLFTQGIPLGWSSNLLTWR